MRVRDTEYKLKNGWVLRVGRYGGSYKIEKDRVYGIRAIRTTGGQWGSGVWVIRILDSICADNTHTSIDTGFSIEDCNSIVDTLETLMSKYNILDYNII